MIYALVSFDNANIVHILKWYYVLYGNISTILLQWKDVRSYIDTSIINQSSEFNIISSIGEK